MDQDQQIKELELLVEQKGTELQAKEDEANQKGMEVSKIFEAEQRYKDEASMVVAQVVEQENEIKLLKKQVNKSKEEATKQRRMNEYLLTSSKKDPRLQLPAVDDEPPRSLSCPITPTDEFQQNILSVPTDKHHIHSSDNLQAKVDKESEAFRAKHAATEHPQQLSQDDLQAQYDDIKKTCAALGAALVERESRLKKQSAQIEQLMHQNEVCTRTNAMHILLL